MPLLPWNLWKHERSSVGALDEEIDRLAADGRVHRVFEWFSRHEREIADFQLAITSVPAPPYGEQERARWLSVRLADVGLQAASDEVGNLIALRSGLRPESATVAISAHLDTVFPAETPLEVRRENARLLGPGISDNGSGLAALWALASAFAECGIATLAPLMFVANVGEEGEGNLRGIRHLYRVGEQQEPAGSNSARAALPGMLIALDGAGTTSIIGQALGSRRFEVVISGPGGHSWSDFGTPNPIVAAALAIQTLFRASLPVQPRTTLNIGAIEGGTSINTIPERVVFKVDFRSSDKLWLNQLEQWLRRAVPDACAEVESQTTAGRGHLAYRIDVVGERPAGELAANSALLAAVRAVDAHLGIQSQLQRASTDANIPLSLGLEAVSLGSGGSGGGAHTMHEWYEPAGREQGLKRLALLLLLLAGLPPVVSPLSTEAP